MGGGSTKNQFNHDSCIHFPFFLTLFFFCSFHHSKSLPSFLSHSFFSLRSISRSLSLSFLFPFIPIPSSQCPICAPTIPSFLPVSFQFFSSLFLFHCHQILSIPYLSLLFPYNISITLSSLYLLSPSLSILPILTLIHTPSHSLAGLPIPSLT